MDLKTILPIEQNELRLSVSGRDGLTLVAAIRPTAITTTYVSGEVEWIGAGPPACFIHSIREETYWRRYLTLVFAAAGPHSAPDVPVFQATQWVSAELTLPDFLGEREDVVRVSVHRHDWKAQLSVTCQPELAAEAEIPRGLRKLDAVTTVIEMTARIFLRRSWLTKSLAIKALDPPNQTQPGMTTPYERTRALIETNLLLHELQDPNLTPRVPASVREIARRLLRHYPSYSDIELAHKALPMWYGSVPPLSRAHGQTAITALGLDKIGSKE